MVEAAVWCVLAGLPMYKRMSNTPRVLFASAMFVLLALLVKELLRFVEHGLEQTPIWDVGNFWIWSRVALTSHRVYDPQTSIAIGTAIRHSSLWQTHNADFYAWRREFLQVGFIYPPPSILLFAPLGLFGSFVSAAPFWYAANLIALVAAITVLWRAFLKQYGFPGLLATAVLVLAFNAIGEALWPGQPLTLELLFVALFTVDASPARRGLWLGFAFIVKPLALVLLLLPIVKRCWAEVLSAIATIAIAFVGAVLLLGWSNVFAYFINGPSRRYPLSMWIGVENGNESLFSALVRILHQPVPDSLLHDWPFLLCALIFTAASALLCAMPGVTRNVAGSLLIALALLIFPPAAAYYNAILLVPIFVLLSHSNPRTYLFTAAYLSALYGLLVYSTALNVLAPLSTWFVFAGMILETSVKRPIFTAQRLSGFVSKH